MSQVLTQTCVVLLHSVCAFDLEKALREERWCMVSMGIGPRVEWHEAARDVRHDPVRDQQSLCPGRVILYFLTIG